MKGDQWDKWDKLDAVSEGAALTESKSKPVKKRTVRKTVANLPIEHVEAHKKLFDECRVNCDLSNYIYRALENQLKADGGLNDH